LIYGQGFVVVKQGFDFLGIGKNKKTYIQNYVPKERRVSNEQKGH